MKTDNNLTVAFSGHRVISPPIQHSLFDDTDQNNLPDSEYINIIKEKTQTEIEKLCNIGYKTFLCGMAEGFDLLAGKIILEVKEKYPDIRLIAVIPHPLQSSAFKGHSKEIYERIIKEAEGNITICPTYTYDCFHKRNDYMVDNSDVLICFFNGTKGGTEYTVKRAIKAGLKIINIC